MFHYNELQNPFGETDDCWSWLLFKVCLLSCVTSIFVLHLVEFWKFVLHFQIHLNCKEAWMQCRICIIFRVGENFSDLRIPYFMPVYIYPSVGGKFGKQSQAIFLQRELISNHNPVLIKYCLDVMKISRECGISKLALVETVFF